MDVCVLCVLCVFLREVGAGSASIAFTNLLLINPAWPFPVGGGNCGLYDGLRIRLGTRKHTARPVIRCEYYTVNNTPTEPSAVIKTRTNTDRKGMAGNAGSFHTAGLSDCLLRPLLLRPQIHAGDRKTARKC